ncbi:hypothetical protein QCA50_004907 [Cerrena zonata]|uniref:Proteasome activator Blm10 middle HEAT repeats region domain-containing protein n=1 Tax=Cerrena zonata TaxID=2478898 RepID=A0AAW0GDB4_9APHY
MGAELLSTTIIYLTWTYTLTTRFVNPEEWKNKDFQASHYLHWGCLYKLEDVKISWHIPQAAEIDFALELFRNIVEPAMNTLKGLIRQGDLNDTIWRNDFCRHLTFASKAFSDIFCLVRDVVTPEELRANIETSDVRYEIPEMLAAVEPISAPWVLRDPAHPDYQYLTDLRKQFGTLLHQSSMMLRHDEGSAIDAIQVLTCSIRTYLLECGDDFQNGMQMLESLSNDMNSSRQFPHQKELSRKAWAQKARTHNTFRFALNYAKRRYTDIEDHLIHDVVEWSLWQYATVREENQSLLGELVSYYDGSARRVLPVLYGALDPSTGVDRMKGALWTLKMDVFVNYITEEPDLVVELVRKIFMLQQVHKDSSMQDYVAALVGAIKGGLTEPCLLIYDIDNPYLDSATKDLKRTLIYVVEDTTVTVRARKQRNARVKIWDESAKKAVEDILTIAQSPDIHWVYTIYAVQFLQFLIRRDVPPSPSQLKYLLEKLSESNETIRYVWMSLSAC